jgi:hypothetical protein
LDEKLVNLGEKFDENEAHVIVYDESEDDVQPGKSSTVAPPGPPIRDEVEGYDKENAQAVKEIAQMTNQIMKASLFKGGLPPSALIAVKRMEVKRLEKAQLLKAIEQVGRHKNLVGLFVIRSISLILLLSFTLVGKRKSID